MSRKEDLLKAQKYKRNVTPLKKVHTEITKRERDQTNVTTTPQKWDMERKKEKLEPKELYRVVQKRHAVAVHQVQSAHPLGLQSLKYPHTRSLSTWFSTTFFLFSSMLRGRPVQGNKFCGVVRTPYSVLSNHRGSREDFDANEIIGGQNQPTPLSILQVVSGLRFFFRTLSCEESCEKPNSTID